VARVPPGVPTEQQRAALVGAVHADQAAKRGGLAGAVAAEQREHRARRHRKRDPIEHDPAAQPHRHRFERKHGSGHFLAPAVMRA
jgi:hypothetical protein